MLAGVQKEEIRRRWIERLESGTVKQQGGGLGRVDGRRCCLGVLCDVLVEFGVLMPPKPSLAEPDVLAWGSKTGTLPSVAVRAVGLRSAEGKPHANARGLESLAYMNDVQRRPLREIAKTLREHAGAYFVDGNGVRL